LITGEFYRLGTGDPSYEGGAIINLRTGDLIAIHFGNSDGANTSDGDTSMVPVTPELVAAARKAGVNVTVAGER
jgi:hypothetical protein